MTAVTEPRLGPRIGRAVVANVTLVPAQGVLSLLATALVARYLRPELFAVYAIFLALKSSLLFYADFGASTAGSKFFPEVIEREGRAGALKLFAYQGGVTGLTMVALAAGLSVTASTLAGSLGIEEGAAFVLRYAVIALFLEEAGRLAQTFLWTRFAHRTVNVVNLVSTAAQPLAILLAISLSASLNGVLLACVAASAVQTVLMAGAAVVELRRLPRLPRAHTPGLFRRFAKVSALSWIEKLWGYLYGTSFLTLLLATALDKTSLAFFALASQFTMRVLSLVLSPTHGIILPAFSTLYATRDQAQYGRAFTSTLRVLALLLGPSAALVVGLAPYVIPLLYSPTYTPAVLIVQILVCFTFAEYSIYAPANAALLASEQLRAYTIIKVASIAALPLVAWALFHVPLPAVPAVYGGARLCTTALLLLASRRAQQLSMPARFYGRLLSASGLAAALALGAGWLLGEGALSGGVVALLILGTLTVGFRRLGCVGPSEWATLDRLNLPGTRLLHRVFAA